MYMKKLTFICLLTLIGISVQAKVITHVVTTYDTIMQVHDTVIQQLAAEQPKPKWQDASHRIFAGVGAGYGALGYKVNDGLLSTTSKGSVAAMLEANYAFFFNEHWGISAGIGMDYYPARLEMEGKRVYPNFIESDGEACDLTLQAQSVKEKNHLLTFSFPIMAQTEWMLTPKVGIYGAAGIRLQLPIYGGYNLYKGELSRTGYYDQWHLTIDDVHDFGRAEQEEKGKLDTKSFGLSVEAQVGCVLPLTPSIDLGVGLYGMCMATSLYSGSDAYYFTEQGEFLPVDYKGFSSTNSASAMHPWQVGVQVSVRWKKAVTPKPAPEVWEPVTLYDTTWTVVPHYDTIQEIEPDTVVAQAIQKVIDGAIIWFDLDDATPKLDPVDMLDQLAQILVENPEQEIEVNGHTCDIGKKAYNERLSMRRAQAVADLLKQKGVREEQIHLHAYANSKPYYSKSHDRYLDRRVEIIPIVKK